MSQRQSQVPALNWHLPVTAAELPSLGTHRSREGPRAPAGDSAGPRQRLLRARPRARRAQEGKVTARFTISWQHAPPQGHSYSTALHQCLPQARQRARGVRSSGGEGGGTQAVEGMPGSGLCMPKPRRTRCAAISRSHRALQRCQPTRGHPCRKKGMSCRGFLSNFQPSLPLYLSFPVIETSRH